MRSVFRCASLIVAVQSALLAGSAEAAIRPGSYSVKAKVLSISGPGLTPAIIKQILAKPANQEQMCYTKDDATKPYWFSKCPGNSVPAFDDCEVEDKSSGSRVDAIARCKEGTTKVVGTYTPVSFALKYTVTNAAGTLVLDTTGQRNGDCPDETETEEGEE